MAALWVRKPGAGGTYPLTTFFLGTTRPGKFTK
jgi:hypothetical protein